MCFRGQKGPHKSMFFLGGKGGRERDIQINIFWGITGRANGVGEKNGASK